jgi:hypothetical protein
MKKKDKKGKKQTRNPSSPSQHGQLTFTIQSCVMFVDVRFGFVYGV